MVEGQKKKKEHSQLHLKEYAQAHQLYIFIYMKRKEKGAL